MRGNLYNVFCWIRAHAFGASIWRSPENENCPDAGELIQMWVAPEVRGGSVAADLLLEVFRWAASNRFAFVNAEVMKANASALRFYEKFGFSLSADNPAASSVLLTKPVDKLAHPTAGNVPI